MHECLNEAYCFVVFLWLGLLVCGFNIIYICCSIKFLFLCLLNYFIKHGRDEPSGFLAISLVKFESL